MGSGLEWLYARPWMRRDHDLETIAELCHRVGDPQNDLAAIQIAGTNGKGSVAHMVSEALSAAGYQVGLFTSPHLISFSERIRINQSPIDPAELEQLISELKPHVEKMQTPSFFEVSTALALLYFKRRSVDLAVLEVGLGGRLDATSICNPVCSAVTSIGLDHQAILGTTIEEIALEKASIARSGIPLVNGAAEGAGVVSEFARTAGATLVFPRAIEFIEGHATLSLGDHQIAVDFVDRPTCHQHNLEIAISILEQVAERFPIVGRRFAFQPQFGISGRYQWARPDILLDVAHNRAAIMELTSALKRLERPIVVLVGCSKPRNPRQVLDPLLDETDEIWLARVSTRRAWSPQQLASELDLEPRIFPDIATALQAWEDLSAGRLLVVTGSSYLVGEVSAVLAGREVEGDQGGG